MLQTVSYGLGGVFLIFHLMVNRKTISIYTRHNPPERFPLGPKIFDYAWKICIQSIDLPDTSDQITLDGALPQPL
jgi:hypothetical protein